MRAVCAETIWVDGKFAESLPMDTVRASASTPPKIAPCPTSLRERIEHAWLAEQSSEYRQRGPHLEPSVRPDAAQLSYAPAQGGCVRAMDDASAQMIQAPGTGRGSPPIQGQLPFGS